MIVAWFRVGDRASVNRYEGRLFSLGFNFVNDVLQAGRKITDEHLLIASGLKM